MSPEKLREIAGAFGPGGAFQDAGAELVAFAVTVKAKQVGPVRIELPCRPSRSWDMYAAIDAPLSLTGGARARLSTGWSFRVPEGFEVTAISRPELALEHGVTVLAYDQGEDGEPFSVILHNRDRQPYTIAPRTRIARAVVVPVAVLRAFEEARD